MTPEIAPSILAADFLRLHEQVQAAERGGARRFQIDVMDGVFVPNISFGMPLVEAMRRATDTLLEAHLMIVQPERYLEQFAQVRMVRHHPADHIRAAARHVRSVSVELRVAPTVDGGSDAPAGHPSVPARGAVHQAYGQAEAERIIRSLPVAPGESV